jgi:UDP-N-acetylmuramoylalanine--D-glutamate ligase
MNSNFEKSILKLKSVCVYGLGSTGVSVVKFLKKKTDKKIHIWDDDPTIKIKHKTDKNTFSKNLNLSDFIVMSPGISLNNTKLKKYLLKNKKKIITDLDLFYLYNPKIKTIVVTGTNGKSTTCKIIEHVLKTNKINVKLGGNIGKPILSLNLKNQPLVIIEASSFQLSYSKHIKPNYAILLNISKDHLDWHNSMNKYIDSKLKIFSNQEKKHFAYLNNKELLKKFNKNFFLSKVDLINIATIKKLRKKINNQYLESEINVENLSFAHAVCKNLKISDQSFVNSLRSFKGLPHRYETILKSKDRIFINDSKATSFGASKFALKNNKNIFWIVGGYPKRGDKFILEGVKKNIIKCYIIGKNTNFFKQQIKNKIMFEKAKTIKNAIHLILRDIKKFKCKYATVLLSPASASYDQYKNFNERGNDFKKIVKKYGNK